MMKVYFAHGMADYGTQREQNCLKAIAALFNHEIVNPNSPGHSKAANGTMSYFNNLASSCDAMVAMPFSDGAFGSGVCSEIDATISAGKDVLVLSETGVVVPRKKVLATHEEFELAVLDTEKITRLTWEATVRRIREAERARRNLTSTRITC